jgi:hypothetical protein
MKGQGGRAYSQDLRDRVLASEGESIRAVAAHCCRKVTARVAAPTPLRGLADMGTQRKGKIWRIVLKDLPGGVGARAHSDA